MRVSRFRLAATLALWTCALAGSALLTAQDTIEGEQLDPALYGPSFVESMETAIQRDLLAPALMDSKDRQGRHGVWTIPSRRATTFSQSGEHYAINKWGDTRMGIGFPGLVDVHGAFFAGQADQGVWTSGVRAIGYRDGRQVRQTDWFHDIGPEPRWFAMDLHGVDRIEIEALPVLGGAGWYGMDNLTYSFAGDATSEPEAQARDNPSPEGKPGEQTVVDFDDLSYRTKLTGSGYAGLTWEAGTGDFLESDGVPSPLAPPDARLDQALLGGGELDNPSPEGGTLPTLVTSFQAVIRGDAGSYSYPPDTDGAVGPDHYLETVNRNFAVYDKATGAEMVNILLGSFLPGSNGDPRTLYDQHSGRWIVIVCDFSATASIYLAVSLTSDPTGDWFKTSWLTAQGPDAGRWPDYHTGRGCRRYLHRRLHGRRRQHDHLRDRQSAADRPGAQPGHDHRVPPTTVGGCHSTGSHLRLARG